MIRGPIVVLVSVLASVASPADARLWTDSAGHYTFEADLFALNEKSVVLQRADHDLVAIPIEQLSRQDQDYLRSTEAAETSRRSLDRLQTWTLQNGDRVVGRIVDYAQGDMTIQQRRGRTYVNDRPLANLPEFYQVLLPRIVAHFENLPRGDRESFDAWLARQRGRPRTFALQGVVLETDSGDEYTVPFFLFADGDQSLLKSGYQDWVADRQGDNFAALDDRAFRLRSLAAARQRDSQVQREIAQLKLQLQAVQAGLTSLWEVTLFPPAGRGGAPIWVVIPARDSRQATETALRENPGFVAGPVRRMAG